MIPETLPKGTTLQEWKQYELDAINHKARCDRKRKFLGDVLVYAGEHGFEKAFTHFAGEIDKEQFMDAPNEPGYYRANND